MRSNTKEALWIMETLGELCYRIVYDASSGSNYSLASLCCTCKAHILAKIAARETLGDNSFYVSRLYSHNQ